MKFRHRPSVNHYQGKLEVIDFAASNYLDFFTGNITKYICRCYYKHSAVDDLRKAEQYLLLLIELETNLDGIYRLCRLLMIRLNGSCFTTETIQSLASSYQLGLAQINVIQLVIDSRFQLNRATVIEMLLQAYRVLSSLIAYEESKTHP